MTPEHIESIARAGFVASGDPRPWADVDDNIREFWRISAHYTTPAEIRRARFTGYYGRLDWHDLPTHTKALWRRISVAMLEERRRLGLPLSGDRLVIDVADRAAD